MDGCPGFVPEGPKEIPVQKIDATSYLADVHADLLRDEIKVAWRTTFKQFRGRGRRRVRERLSMALRRGRSAPSSCSRYQAHLHRLALVGRELEGFEGRLERHAVGDQRLHVDPAFFQETHGLRVLLIKSEGAD